MNVSFLLGFVHERVMLSFVVSLVESSEEDVVRLNCEIFREVNENVGR